MKDIAAAETGRFSVLGLLLLSFGCPTSVYANPIIKNRVNMKSKSIRYALIRIGSTVPCVVFSTVCAANMVINGDFEDSGGIGQLFPGYSFATGWSVGEPDWPASSPSAYILNNQADTIGFPSVDGNRYFWGPGTGSNNGFMSSSNGGSFLGINGSYGTVVLSQAITGLTPGQEYTLSFEWAVAQSTGFYGDFRAWWEFGFGSTAASTAVVDVVSTGFSPWSSFSHTFTASSTTEVLSFRPGAFPNGNDIYSLLDNVNLVSASSIPEPSTFAVLIFGSSFLLGVRRRNS